MDTQLLRRSKCVKMLYQTTMIVTRKKILSLVRTVASLDVSPFAVRLEIVKPS